jgi:valyl-tRNA synthetase
MKRFEARVEIKKQLKEKKLLKQIKDHWVSIGISRYSKDIVEPLFRPQWWINLESSAPKAIEAINSGDLKFCPPFLISQWENWLKKTKNWCISRQHWVKNLFMLFC